MEQCSKAVSGSSKAYVKDAIKHFWLDNIPLHANLLCFLCFIYCLEYKLEFYPVLFFSFSFSVFSRDFDLVGFD